VWFKNTIPRQSFLPWLVVQQKFTTQDKIHRFGVHGPNRCPLCLQNNEDHNSAKERPVESDVRQIDKSPIGDKKEFQTMHQLY
jgi:hypothetical protein